MRKAVHEIDLGEGQSIKVLSPEVVSNMTGVARKDRIDAYVKFGVMINDYASTTTLESTASSRQMFYWGQLEGAPVGEMLRNAAQFKQAGVQMVRLQARLAGSMDHASYAAALGLFTFAGYLTLGARDILMRGKDSFPTPDPSTEEGKKEWAYIAMESFNRGAGGIIGDMLFAEYHKSYRSLTGDLMGPVPADIAKAAKFAASISRGEYDRSEQELINFAKSMVPFPANAPVIKPLMEAIIFDPLANSVSPNMELNRRIKDKKRGQAPIKDLF